MPHKDVIDHEYSLMRLSSVSIKTRTCFFIAASPVPSTRSASHGLGMMLKWLQKDRQRATPSPWGIKGVERRAARAGHGRPGAVPEGSLEEAAVWSGDREEEWQWQQGQLEAGP